jgi:hypothetical protein
MCLGAGALLYQEGMHGGWDCALPYDTDQTWATLNASPVDRQTGYSHACFCRLSLVIGNACAQKSLCCACFDEQCLCRAQFVFRVFPVGSAPDHPFTRSVHVPRPTIRLEHNITPRVSENCVPVHLRIRVMVISASGWGCGWGVCAHVSLLCMYILYG